MTDAPLILEGRETGEGDGAPLVLLHGLFGQSGNFGAVARRLGATRRVIALDLRNHGSSPHAPGMDYAAMAADVLASLAVRGALPAVIVGHSMGGKVAMQVAASAPGQVAALCVVDIAPRAYSAGLGRYVAAMQAVPLYPGLTRGEADMALAALVPDAGIRAFLLQNLRLDTSPPSWRLNLAALAAHMPVISGWVPEAGVLYRGPTLFLAGEKSDYITEADRPAILDRFPAARFAKIPGAGHWVHAEAPDAFLAALEAFLSSPEVLSAG